MRTEPITGGGGAGALPDPTTMVGAKFPAILARVIDEPRAALGVGPARSAAGAPRQADNVKVRRPATTRILELERHAACIVSLFKQTLLSKPLTQAVDAATEGVLERQGT